MSHTPHELSEEFPSHVAMLHELRLGDAHFKQLSDKYHEVNRAVHRAETDIEPTDDLHMAELRRERMRLKDEIWSILQKASA